MSYATPANVKACFRNFANTTEAAVTDAKIQDWLDAKHAMVTGKINTLYSPIVEANSPLAVKMLAEIEAFLVAGIVDDVLNSYSEADKKPQWEKRGMMMLNELVPGKDKDGFQPEPTTKLPDAVYVGTRSQTAKPKITSGNSSSPTFVKGGDNW